MQIPPPPAMGKNVALPIGLGAGAALAGGIAAGQGYWHFFVPKAEETLNDNTADKALDEKKLVALKEQKFDELFGSEDSVSYIDDDDAKTEIKSNYLNGNVKNESPLTGETSETKNLESWKENLQEYLSTLNDSEKKREVMNAYLETPEVIALKKQNYYSGDLFITMPRESEECANPADKLLEKELMAHWDNIDNLLALHKELIENEKALEKMRHLTN